MTLHTLGLRSHQIVYTNNVIYDKYLLFLGRPSVWALEREHWDLVDKISHATIPGLCAWLLVKKKKDIKAYVSFSTWQYFACVVS